MTSSGTPRQGATGNRRHRPPAGRKREAASPWAALRNDRRLTLAKKLPTDQDVAAVQELFEQPLPKAWVSWVTECGSITACGRALLGLDRHENAEREAADALDLLRLLRLTEPGFASDLLPVEILPDRQLSCIAVREDAAPVLVVDLDRPEVRVPVAPNLADFVYGWRDDIHALATVVEEVLAQEDSDEVTLLRPDEWSTRRLCSQDVIVALLETRHNRELNERDVALFATATLTSFAPGAPVRWALTTILTEGYQAGGSLAVNFVRRARDGETFHPRRVQGRQPRIPATIVRWAREHGIVLDGRESRWTHEIGEALFLAAVMLPDSLREVLQTTPVKPATVGAAVSTGVWPALEVETVLRWAEAPNRILTGAVAADDRLRYLADQHVVRCAIMLSSLLRYLQRSGQASASLDDDTARTIHVSMASESANGIDRTLAPVRFSAFDGAPLEVDWPNLGSPLLARSELVVHVLPIDADLLVEIGPATIATLAQDAVLLVPADARARVHTLGGLTEVATAAGIPVIVAPDYTTSMDVAIAARLDRSRMSRQ